MKSLISYFFVLFFLLFHLSVSYSADKVLIKKPGSFQLNPTDPKANEGVFLFKKMINECFEHKNIDYEKTITIINKMISASSETTTISCEYLVSEYMREL
ncbi:hypothetical protein [sulfur-oxidizing endosymbiont of Gigantopelta aegis]|uniref:hypothetical protein n=1 Tax=sulfur-oxidizing endosymbiont of Gigantopelta aegis TaxID=2794934 RepID=UPI0018DBD212|nr:hypothetical protein [sulfur-oxidizing endosymbiont of Gigantopelta aegis]